MKQIYRSFSIGLFAAGIIMLFVYYFSGAPANTAEDMELEELIPLVEEKGHRVVTEEEYIALSVQSSNKEEKTEENSKKAEENKKDTKKEKDNEDSAKNSKKDKDPEENKSDKKEGKDKEDKKDGPVEYTLQISSGMASSEIGSILAEKDIIEDAQEFTDYLEEHEYSVRVKAGEHDVSSDMSFYELAEELVSY